MRLLTSYRNTAVWPGSAVLEIVAGLFPAVMFVWIGVFVSLALRRQAVTRVGWMGILLALSTGTGLGVVSAATMLRLGATGLDLHMLSRTDFYHPVSHSRFSALLFLCLFAAIGLLPRERDLDDRRQD